MIRSFQGMIRLFHDTQQNFISLKPKVLKLYAQVSLFLVAAHHQKKMALSANINMLNDNMTNRKTLGLGFNFSF